MLFTDTQIAGFIGQYLWPLTRISAFFMAAPLFGTKLVSSRIRIGLSFAVTLAIVPLLPPMPAVEAVSLQNLIIIFHQVMIGLAMGFVMQMSYQLFVLAGQMIAMQMGLGFASMMDPANGVTVTVLSQFFLILVTLLFLAVNGHLVMVETLVESFRTLPIAVTGFPRETYWELVTLGSWLFRTAVLLALPAVVALLIVNLTFGVMSRAAPQLNVFSLGFPMAILLGLFILRVIMSDFLPSYEKIISTALLFMRQIVNA